MPRRWRNSWNSTTETDVHFSEHGKGIFFWSIVAASLLILLVVAVPEFISVPKERATPVIQVYDLEHIQLDGYQIMSACDTLMNTAFTAQKRGSHSVVRGVVCCPMFRIGCYVLFR